MKFILWTLVWLGLSEIAYWRQYKYLGAEYFKENTLNNFLYGIVIIILWFYLYDKFVN